MGPNKNLLAKLKSEKGFDLEAQRKKKEVKTAEKRKRQKEETKKAEQEFLGDEIEVGDAPKAVENGDKEAEAEEFEGIDAEAEEEDDEEVDEEVDEDEDDEDAEDSDVPLSDLSEDDRADTVPHQRLTINNTAALLSSTKRVRIARAGQKFSVHNSLVSSIPTNIPDVDDDLTRELEFYRVCQTAADQARKLLKKESIPFSRPTDYFAEMVKSDEHMGKIKAKLYDEAARKKASQEARKQRDLKKFGKQVQVAKEQERAKEKRQMLEKVKDLKRKRKGMDTGKVNEDDDLFDVGVDNDDERPSKRRDGGDRKDKRQARDKKFGFGGKKRFSKSNDAAGASDMSGFSAKRMKGKGGAAKSRPGKARRAAGRS